MRVASYLGFLVMVVIGVAAFFWVDVWWATALLLLVALAVGWYSLGLFARASTASAHRALRGAPSPNDINALGHLGDRQLEEAISRAAAAPDPERDRLYGEMIDTMGGLATVRSLVISHMAGYGIDVDEGQADRLLDNWRRYGVVRSRSLGEHLDAVVNHPE